MKYIHKFAFIKRQQMIRKSLLFLFILSSTFASAQRIKITGTVYNQKKEPLENVVISQTGTTNGTYSDTKGRYQFNINTSDSVKILFSLIGYRPQQFILPNLKDDVELDVILHDTSKALAPIIIEGNRSITTGIENIDYIGIKRASNPWGSIESMLATMGGVSSTNELSSQYSVRGGNFDENIVYVNGIEIYRPLLVRSAQQEGLSFINPNIVHTVGFSAGGFSAEYGDKMSSVLDVTYKRPERFEGGASASMMGGDIYIGNSSGKFSQITGFRYKTIQSLLNTTDTKAEYDPSFADIQTYMTYALTPKWEVDFLGNYSHTSYEFTPASRETTFGTLTAPKAFMVYFNGWEDDRFLTYQAALTVKGKIGRNVNIGFTGSTFSSDEQERYDIQGRYALREGDLTGDNNQNSGSSLGIGSYHEHARNKVKSDVYTFTHFGNLRLSNNLIKWGITAQREKVNDKIKEWEMRDSAGYSLPSNGINVNVFSNLKADNHISSSRISGYIQDTYNFDTDKGVFILNAGVRASYWSFNKETIISPRGSLSFVPHSNPNLAIRIAGGIYYQSPFYKEFQYMMLDEYGNNFISLNREIKSQKSIHIVLGTDFYFGGDKAENKPPFKLSGELYYKKLTDLIPYTVNNVKIRYAGRNMADGHTMGADVKLYGEFIPGADSWISLSFMKAEQNIYDTKVPLPTDQRFNFALFYQDYFRDYDRLKMSLRGLWSQGLPVSAPHKGYESGYFRTPAYKRVDIGFAWLILGENFNIRHTNSFCKAFKNIWLGMDIFNIFDMQNTNTYYWVTDVLNHQYAVPNYLTGRQINIKLLAEF